MVSLQHDYVLNRKEQLNVYLTNECRPDGREFDAVKPIVVSPDVYSSSCFGSSMVKWGHTLVSCSVTLQLGTPSPQSPTEGSLVFDAGLWSICSTAFDSQRHKKPSEALLIESALSRLYTHSGAIDLTQLCVEPGKSAFCLSVQVACLSSDGSLLEACILAVSTALSRTVLPAVSLDSNMKLQVLSPSRAREQLAIVLPSQDEEGDSIRGFRHSQALQVRRHFVALSLGMAVVGSGEVLLLDPSPQEHLEAADSVGGERVGQLLEGHVLVVVDLEGNLCLVEGSGSMSVDKELNLCEAASRHAQTHIAPLLQPLLP